MTQTPPAQETPVDGAQARFEDELLDHMTGDWKLSRRIRQQLVENEVHVEWILNHQFLQIHMKDVQTPPTYEALVLIGYEHEHQRYVIYWLDTFGGRFSEKGYGTRQGQSIRFVFQYPDGLLHNTFTWHAADQTWRSLIEQQDDQGRWSVFAEDKLQRRQAVER